MADFVWGDIAAPRGGTLRLTLGPFRVAMGLGHAIRENARAVFPGPSAPDQMVRAPASGAVLTLNGPVIALNVLLLAGLWRHWLFGRMGLPDGLSGWRLAAGAIIGGLVALSRLTALPSRHTAGWVVLAGGLALLMLVADTVAEPFRPSTAP